MMILNNVFIPSNIGQIELKNRIVMPAIHLCYSEDGHVNDKIIEFYQARAAGGVGAIIVGGCAVEKRGSLPKMISISDQSCIQGLSNLITSIKGYGCKVFLQLFHAGRNAVSQYTDTQPIAPSPVPSPITREEPKDMTLDDIAEVIAAFVNGAQRAKQAGADGVEISASAGYLLSQFLSPLTNKRTDFYGGSPERRMNFAKEVISRIRETVGQEFPIILRVSGSDMLAGGADIRFMQYFCSSIAGMLDAIHVTGGWHESPVPQITAHVPPGNYAYLAAAIKSVVNVPVMAANRINNLQTANEIITKGLADFVAMGRGLIADPEHLRKAAEGVNIRSCVACNQGCIDNIFKAKPVRCLVNPQAGFEKEGNIKKAPTNKKVLVIGAGPAGMEAARVAALRGFDVTLYSDQENLGGQLNLAKIPPYKQELGKIIDYYQKELSQLKVKTVTGTVCGRQQIEDIAPDYVIVATGSKPQLPAIPGINNENVYTAWQILANKRYLPKGKIVLIGGGVVGLETANYLINKLFISEESINFVDKFMGELRETSFYIPDITILEMENKFGRDMGPSTRWILLKTLKEYGINLLPQSEVIAINSSSITVDNGQHTQEIPADTVIITAGVKSDSFDLIKFLEKSNCKYFIIGDANKPGKINDAIYQGYSVGNKIPY